MWLSARSSAFLRGRCMPMRRPMPLEFGWRYQEAGVVQDRVNAVYFAPAGI